MNKVLLGDVAEEVRENAEKLNKNTERGSEDSILRSLFFAQAPQNGKRT